ncbi:hypothetical protein B6U98_00990 [Thermoplasmatales archaeon ex4572_165]|nr:MAG: hypothetical protein B6U98_00990 [Thermoplasmatales archaeon ex4572_165]RLF58566.1 MAG: hypothetical protein DRN27_05070 [Thermoplasmata archaeon]
MAEETEKIYVIPLKKKNYPGSIAAPTAMKRVKQYLIKHMKVEESDIWIDESLNHEVWKRGKYNMPNKLRVKAVKFDDGVVEVYLPELEFTKSRREILQDEKAKKQPILLKDEEADEDEEMDTGADDYNVVPTADGDVKIKKKKTEKESDETDEEETESENSTDESADVAEEEPKEKESAKPVKEKKKTESSDNEKKKESSDKDIKESD